MEYLDHAVLIEEWKKIDADAYEKNPYKDVKLPSINEKLIIMIKLNTGQHA